jgi:alkylhydroperoxidase family enzyme
MAHGAVLRQNLFSADQVQAIVRDFRSAGLEPAEVAMLVFVEKVIDNARGISYQDIDELRSHGLSDAEILDVTLAAAARSFFGKVLDAMGTEPDSIYMELEEGLREILTVGRPFEGRDNRG